MTEQSGKLVKNSNPDLDPNPKHNPNTYPYPNPGAKHHHNQYEYIPNQARGKRGRGLFTN